MSKTLNPKDDLIKKFCSAGTSHDRFNNPPRVYNGNGIVLEGAYQRLEKDLLKNRL